MNDDKSKRKFTTMAAIIIVFVFVAGFAIGYSMHDLMSSEYLFKSGINILQNSGFELELNGEPAYWSQESSSTSNLTFSWDENIFYNGSKSVSINKTGLLDEMVTNSWVQTLENIPVSRTIQLSGWIKTNNVENATMSVQFLDKNEELLSVKQIEEKITGTHEWSYVSTSVDVPYESAFITISLSLEGTGHVWFDQVMLIVE